MNIESESEVTQSCPTLCNLVDCSLPGSSVHGMSQASILGWIAISFSRGSSQAWDQTRISCIAGEFFTDWATREGWHLSRSPKEVGEGTVLFKGRVSQAETVPRAKAPQQKSARWDHRTAERAVWPERRKHPSCAYSSFPIMLHLVLTLDCVGFCSPVRVGSSQQEDRGVERQEME